MNFIAYNRPIVEIFQPLYINEIINVVVKIEFLFFLLILLASINLCCSIVFSTEYNIGKR